MKILSPVSMAASIDMGASNKLTNLANGTGPQDSATKFQLDAVGAPVGFTEIVDYLRNRHDQIQFTDGPTDSISISAGNPVNVKIGVTDGDGVVVPWPLLASPEVTLTLVSNTTGQTIRANGTPIGAGYVVDLSAANEVSVAITQVAAGVGMVVLGLSDSGGTGLDVSDQFTITYV